MDLIQNYKAKIINRIFTLFIMSLIFVIFAFMGYMISGYLGLVVSLVFVFVILNFNAGISSAIVMKLHRAREIDLHHAPGLFAIMRALTERASLGYIPALYLINSPVLNAFTTGPKENASIAITSGLLNSLTREELAGVLAHELSHIQNNDLWLNNLAEILSRVTSAMSTIGQVILIIFLPLFIFADLELNLVYFAVLLTAPFITLLLQMALSRVFEYEADRGAAQLTGNPLWLAMALKKIQENSRGYSLYNIFFPLRKKEEDSLFRSHPATDKRIEKLIALSNQKTLWNRGNGETDYSFSYSRNPVSGSHLFD